MLAGQQGSQERLAPRGAVGGTSWGAAPSLPPRLLETARIAWATRPGRARHPRHDHGRPRSRPRSRPPPAGSGVHFRSSDREPHRDGHPHGHVFSHGSDYLPGNEAAAWEGGDDKSQGCRTCERAHPGRAVSEPPLPRPALAPTGAGSSCPRPSPDPSRSPRFSAVFSPALPPFPGSPWPVSGGKDGCVLSSGCERPCAPELGAAVSLGSRATGPGVPQRGGSAGLCRLRSRPADEPQPASLGQAACPRAGAWGGAQGERAEALHLETRFQTGRPSSSLGFSGLAAVQGFSNYCGRSSRKTDRLHRVSPVTVKAEALMSSC